MLFIPGTFSARRITALLVGLVGTTAAHAAAYVGPDGGSWNVASNWSPQIVPDSATADVSLSCSGGQGFHIDLGGTVTVNRIVDSCAGAGEAWNLENGTVRFAGTAPYFESAGHHPTTAPALPAVILDASTHFHIVEASNSHVVVGGGISGSGSLTKTGPGALGMVGTQSLTGAITVRDGMVWLPAGSTIPNATTTLESTGLPAVPYLMGGGHFGNAVLARYAVLRPGDSPFELQWVPGTMTFSSLAVNSEAYVHFDLTEQGERDLVAVQGELQRGQDGILHFVFKTGFHVIGSSFTLMTFSQQTGFDLSHFRFTVTGHTGGFGGHFVLTPTSLQFVIDNLPVTLQSFQVD
ncbi:hypothetical protein [Tahibacter amnicola]|uniref:Uncharacterized protein n=1 Tax=Tahibacter amnicola TaxID=2976241 RepID=A0ABY6BK54_9GAMM|nr:hypothetical protein [Tahibacter amnicola]UXI68172.1 hypothetical protein N4264_00525 [Tahibacter amnicola]